MEEEISTKEEEPSTKKKPSTKKEEPSTKLEALWIDPNTKVSAKQLLSKPAKVLATVGILEEHILNKVNVAYSLNPPLKPDDMTVERFPAAAEDEDDVHSINGGNGLVVHISPKKPAEKRIRKRFGDLQKSRKRTSQLVGLILDSDEEDTGTIQDDDELYDLVNMFKDLQRDVGDQTAEIARLKVDSANHKQETARLNRSLRQEKEERKEETARLKEDSAKETARLNRSLRQVQESLRQEQEGRKADSANHKEETAQLNRSLLLEEDSRKKENKHLMAETKQLKATITKEREEREAVVADLEGTIEQQGAKLVECERELRNAKKQRDNDIREISELAKKLVPIHLRILLESSRRKILNSLGYSNWDELRENKNIPQLTDVIFKGLCKVKNVGHLSRESVKFLCAFNSIRQLDGNYSAHNAAQTDIEKAVKLESNAEDASELQELYDFVYPTI